MKNLVFMVEKIPKVASECPFSKWHPYPPMIEDPGYYECILGGNCKLYDDRCSHLKTLDSILTLKSDTPE